MAKCPGLGSFDPLSRTCIGAMAAESSTKFINEDTPAVLEIARGNYNSCEILSSSVTQNLIRTMPATPPTCSCNAGICSVAISPRENSFGNGSLYYRLHNPNTGYKNYLRLDIIIRDVNDAPTLSTLSYTINNYEDGNSISPQIPSTRASIYRFNMCNTIGTALDDIDAVRDVSLEISTPPALGFLSCNECNCTEEPSLCECSFVFDGPNVSASPYTTFGIRFRDTSLATDEATITMNTAAVNDRPYTAVNVDLTGTPLTEDTSGNLTLVAMTDVEDGAAVNYEIASTGNCGSGEPCVHTLEALRQNYGVLKNCLNIDANGDLATASNDNICEFDPYHNVHATSIIFYYRAIDSLNATSDWVRATFRINSVNDPPIPFFAFYEINESKTAWASDAGPYAFNVASVAGEAIDPDENNLASIQTPLTNYSFVSPGPTGARLQNCMNNNNDLNCDFVIDNDNGNLNTAGTATAASGSLSGLSLEAIHKGVHGNLISVYLVSESSDARAKHHSVPSDYTGTCLSATGTYNSCREYFNRIVQVEASGGEISIRILLQTTGYTTTQANVQHLINNHPIASKFIRASGGLSTPATNGNITLSGGADAALGFRAEYTVSDGSLSNAVPNGFISIQITPTNDTPIFCRYSSYEEAKECGLHGCLSHQGPIEKGVIPSSHRESHPLYYYDVTTSICYRSTGTAASNWKIVSNVCHYSTSNSDCNDGDCRAVGPPHGKVTPSTHTNARPVIYQDSRSKVCYHSTGTDSDDWDLMSASLPEIQVNEGEVIKLKRVVFDEGGADPTEDSQRIYISRFYSDNDVLVSLLNSNFSQKVDRRFFPCDFSLSSCNSDKNCRQYETGFSDPVGNVTPTSHTRENPLYFWANQTDDLSCYQSVGTTMSDWVKIIDNTFTETINNYNPQTNNFSLNSGGRTPIGDTTGSEDDDAIEIELIPTTTESGSTVISFDLDDGGCQFSTDSDDCNSGNCTESNMAFANPSGNITPSEHTNAEPVVYMNNANVCYISTGTDDTNWKLIDAWPITTVYFKVTVNPVSAVLPDWENLAASGPAVNKYNEVKSKDSLSCPYSKSKCNSGLACTGDFPPGDPPFSIPMVTADEDYAIYHDTQENTCYFWNPTLKYPNKWQKFINHCNITQSEYATECYNGSCLFDRDVTNPTSLVPTGIDHYYAFYDHDIDKLTCYRSYGIKAGEIGSYEGTGKAVLSWEAFILKGSSHVSGYNIFRRKAHEDFDEIPINRVLLSNDSLTYIDNAVNSKNGPVPGTVYYYQVRPIVDNRETWPFGNQKTARIFVPKANMSFVHRRIANKRMCELMDKDLKLIDGNNHNRCPYIGPGDNASGYYDIEQDFHVATVEAGCPYTVETDSCGTSDGNCIADRIPDDTDDGNNGDFFYNRDEGICYWKNTVSSSWETVSDDMASILTAYGASDSNTKEILKTERPPLARLSQSQAVNLCSDDSLRQSDMIPGCAFSRTGCDTGDTRCTDTQNPDAVGGNYTASAAGIYFWNANEKRCWRANSTSPGDWTLVGGGGGIAPNLLAMRIPTRKEQIAFSFWDKDIDYITAISYEQGLSLGHIKGCNSSSADGLISGYSNLEAPPSHDLYSLPGTYFSGIRSVATGVKETEKCQSIFGIRDIIGNVTEWSSDRLTCSSPYSCAFDSTNLDFTVRSASSQINTAGGFNFGYYDGNSNNLEDAQSIDGFPLGPCEDKDSDRICDSFFGSWPLESRLHRAENFILPLGLPANAEFSSNYENDSAVDAFFAIGSSSGVGGNMLRRDTVEIQSQYIYCPYNKEDSDCSRKDCTTSDTGEGTPMGRITPSEHTASYPVYFFNNNNNQCYRSNGTASTNWQVVGCRYTKDECGGGNTDCTDVDTSLSTPIGNITPTNHTTANPIIFYNSSSGTCYVSTGTSNTNWRTYTSSNVVSSVVSGIVHGGSYLKGTGAGQFHMEIIDFRRARDRKDIGLRCVMEIPNSFYTE